MSNLDKIGRTYESPIRLGNQTFDSRERVDWLNPISMSMLKKAVTAKKKTVVMNGLLFDITYGIEFKMKSTNEIRECVMLKRPLPYASAPFGYIAMKTIMDFEFEGRS